MTISPRLASKRFLADLERGKYPALAAGSRPIKRLMAWMEDGGMLLPDVVAMLVTMLRRSAFAAIQTTPNDSFASILILCSQICVTTEASSPTDWFEVQAGGRAYRP